MKYTGNHSLKAVLAIISLTIVLAQVPVSAHQSGCHRWHSCPSDSGSYVCGDHGYTSECGATSTPVYTPPAVAPRQPVISTRTVTADETIPSKVETVQTNNEYIGYMKIQKSGVTGANRVYTEVTLTDGVETARKVIKSEVIKPPVNTVKLVGSRKKPQAKVTKVAKTSDGHKFNISGTANKNSEVVLSIDDKRIKRAKTDNQGKFTFANIKLSSTKVKVQIYNRIKGKESLISEKSTLNTSTGKFRTNYSDKLNNK